MFGRATIRLGIGPHSSFCCFPGWEEGHLACKNLCKLSRKLLFEYKKENHLGGLLMQVLPGKWPLKWCVFVYYMHVLGSVVDRCKLWLWDGNSWIYQHLSSARLPKDNRCFDTSGLVSRQKETAEEKEGFEGSILEGSISGNYICKWNCIYIMELRCYRVHYYCYCYC